jgi:hypothetical protein
VQKRKGKEKKQKSSKVTPPGPCIHRRKERIQLEMGKIKCHAKMHSDVSKSATHHVHEDVANHEHRDLVLAPSVIDRIEEQVVMN